MQSVVIGLILGAAGAIGLWRGLPEHKLPSGEPSMMALQARVGFGLFLPIGLYMTVEGLLRMLGLVGR